MALQGRAPEPWDSLAPGLAAPRSDDPSSKFRCVSLPGALRRLAAGAWGLSRAEVRAAQFSVAAMRPDTHIILNAAKEQGDPFNTMTLDANGDWASGFVFGPDGQHYLAPSYQVMGHTGAWNAAVHLGFASGPLIGVAP